jgi:hypothetical protein
MSEIKLVVLKYSRGAFCVLVPSAYRCREKKATLNHKKIDLYAKLVFMRRTSCCSKIIKFYHLLKFN